MAFTLYEHANDNDGTIGSTGQLYQGSTRRGHQQFTAESNHPVTLIRVKGHKVESPEGYYVVEVFATDGDGKPTGSVLASGSIPASDFPTSDGWVRIIMSSSMNVTNGILYAIVTKAVDTDGSNKIITLCSSTSIYDGGQHLYSNDSGNTWSLNAVNDSGFEIGEAVAPTIVTNAATNKKDTHCLANGNITDDGGAYITERGFEYGETESADYCVRQTGTDLGEGAYSLTLSGLKSETTYYYRAFATNSYGTAYGDWVSFTTTALPSYGIYEESNAATICFYIRRVGGKWSIKHGPYTSDQADIEITKILTEGKGKYQIKFTSDVLTGLSTSIMCKLDIKARG